MIKVYDIETTTCSSQTHSVVAENIGEAERLFLSEYPTATIKHVFLHSEYVVLTKNPTDGLTQRETCKWKRKYTQWATSPHTDISYGPRHKFKHCPVCDKLIEVVE